MKCESKTKSDTTQRKKKKEFTWPIIYWCGICSQFLFIFIPFMRALFIFFFTSFNICINLFEIKKTEIPLPCKCKRIRWLKARPYSSLRYSIYKQIHQKYFHLYAHITDVTLSLNHKMKFEWKARRFEWEKKRKRIYRSWRAKSWRSENLSPENSSNLKPW